LDLRGCRLRLGEWRPERRTLRDERRDVIPGELGEDVIAALLAAEEESDDKRAILLEEEDVARLLLVHVPTDHPEGRLVEAGVAMRFRSRLPATGDRFLHEPGDVVIEEGQGLLGLIAQGFGPRPACGPGGDDALDDEAVGRLDEEDLAKSWRGLPS
jgi:hypothetical protein